MFGRMVFYLQFLHYIFFLVSITAYILLKLTFTNYQKQLEKNEANSTKCISADEQNEMALMGFRGAVIATVFIAIVIEISELIRMKSRYKHYKCPHSSFNLLVFQIFSLFQSCRLDSIPRLLHLRSRPVHSL